jgi:hypothetical protein
MLTAENWELCMNKFTVLAITALFLCVGCVKGEHSDPAKNIEATNKKLNDTSASVSAANSTEDSQPELPKDNLAKRPCTEDDINNLKLVIIDFEAKSLRLNDLADQLVTVTAEHDNKSVQAPVNESLQIVGTMLTTCGTTVDTIDVNGCQIFEAKSSLDIIVDACSQLKITKTKLETVKTLSNP